MSNTKLFVFEFVSGGGFSQVEIPSSLFCEGYGMLKSIITDFKTFDFEISTILDYRISFLSNYLRADIVVFVDNKDNYIEQFKRTIKKCQMCFIIAPEFSNILYDLTKIAKDNGKKILSIGLEGVELGSSKFRTYEFFKKNKINTPQTYLIPFKDNSLDLDFILQKFNELKCPIIIKPDDGVGAEKIYYLENVNQIYDLFYEYNNKFDQERIYVLQEYIEGEDLSVSLIGKTNKENPIILTVNSQNISIKNSKSDSEYFGGYTPVENNEQIRENIAEILKRLDFSNFNSFFGIDFIKKADNSIYLLEINPRLTTSYIGIRNIINYNLLELIINPKSDVHDSKDRAINMNSTFSRIELVYEGTKKTKEIENYIIPVLVEEIPELITPPISFSTSNQEIMRYYSCFVATKEKDLGSSRNRIMEILKIFEKFDFVRSK